ncbi:hypothetical protein RHGRI_008418 [Rhododendron griersonianum]|uniref:Uncharacterized protein n=1 Tax=Rhododendron griersonianum TaxID=479676 RepID=A0AAV6L0I5_9ERIC|nr:hypothetical protein RHGRI_008418 [Rhododendron griersonianum]
MDPTFADQLADEWSRLQDFLKNTVGSDFSFRDPYVPAEFPIMYAQYQQLMANAPDQREVYTAQYSSPLRRANLEREIRDILESIPGFDIRSDPYYSHYRDMDNQPPISTPDENHNSSNTQDEDEIAQLTTEVESLQAFKTATLDFPMGDDYLAEPRRRTVLCRREPRGGSRARRRDSRERGSHTTTTTTGDDASHLHRRPRDHAYHLHQRPRFPPPPPEPNHSATHRQRLPPPLASGKSDVVTPPRRSSASSELLSPFRAFRSSASGVQLGHRRSAHSHRRSPVKDSNSCSVLASCATVQSASSSVIPHLVVWGCQVVLMTSYVLGEIPSQQDRITIVRQLWDLTQDVLVSFNPMDMFMSQDVHTLVLMVHGIVLPMFVIEFVSPETPQIKGAIDDTSKDLMTLKSGAFVVAPWLKVSFEAVLIKNNGNGNGNQAACDSFSFAKKVTCMLRSTIISSRIMYGTLRVHLTLPSDQAWKMHQHRIGP